MNKFLVDRLVLQDILEYLKASKLIYDMVIKLCLLSCNGQEVLKAKVDGVKNGLSFNNNFSMYRRENVPGIKNCIHNLI